jgi:hypothetical protein
MKHFISHMNQNGNGFVSLKVTFPRIARLNTKKGYLFARKLEKSRETQHLIKRQVNLRSSVESI